MPLKNGVSESHTLNLRLPTNANLYVGFESLHILDPQEKDRYQDVIRNTFGQYFANVYFDTTAKTLTNDEWFQRIGLQSQSNFLLIVRLTSSESGNLIRPRNCSSESSSNSSVTSGNNTNPSSSVAFHHVESAKPKPAQLSPFAEAHPFGPNLSDEGASPNEEESELDAVINEIMNTDAVQQNANNPAIQDADLKKASIKQIYPPQQNKKPNIDIIQVSDLNSPDTGNTVYRTAVLADPKLKVQQPADCEIHFGRGRDAIAISTWLYSRHIQALIDHRQFKGEAGFLGWQLEAVPALFEASMHRLAAQYAGSSYH